jgi:4-diphosphocytidyl-2-C-methyl-D-erythritol kinase
VPTRRPALVGLNATWNLKIPSGDLAQLGASLGADVPFFLTGGTAMGVGRGDQIFPLVDVKPLGVVIIKPSFGVSTADAYGWLDADGRAHLSDPGLGAAEACRWAGQPVPYTYLMTCSRRWPAGIL